MLSVVLKENNEVLAELSFEKTEINIGSDESSDVHLPDARLAPKNAVIEQTETGLWMIEPLDLDKPVQVNGETIVSRTPLSNGDLVVIRTYEMHIGLEDEGEPFDPESDISVPADTNGTGDDGDSEIAPDDNDENQLSAEEIAKIKEYPLPPGSILKKPFDLLHLRRENVDVCAHHVVEIEIARDLPELIDTASGMLLRAFDARAAWLGIRRDDESELDVVGGRLGSGESVPSNPILKACQYRCIKRRQHICVRRVKDHKTVHTAMAVPIMTPNGTLGLVYVDRGHGKKRFQTHDLDLLTTFASIISGKLHAILEQQQQRTSRVAQIEGELVQRLQTLLEPAVSPTWKNLRMSVYTRGGQENPGDICDVIKHPDSELTGFLLGHVTASGAQLALAMARLHSTFRVGFLHNDPPHALLRTINWLAENEENPPMLEAMVFQIDPTSGKFRFSRAGRIGSFIVTPQGVPRQVKGADGPAIGRVSNYEYISKADELKPGESLALYTRGVATTINADGERFSEKRFIELVCDGFGQSPSATIQDISDELAAFFTDGAHPDDISILLLQRTS